MTRTAAVVIAIAVLSGCGSSNKRAAPVQPKLPSTLAATLAQQSDRVATAFDEGDACQALDEARRLQQDTITLINAGQIPGPFQEHLLSTVGDLVARIQCVPPEEDKHGKGKGKHKGKNGEGN